MLHFLEPARDRDNAEGGLEAAISAREMPVVFIAFRIIFRRKCTSKQRSHVAGSRHSGHGSRGFGREEVVPSLLTTSFVNPMLVRRFPVPHDLCLPFSKSYVAPAYRFAKCGIKPGLVLSVA
jgi:hypothetical protein